jgi:hypothetical protein
MHAYHPAVPYLFTGLAGYSVDPGNSRGARKLTRTPRIIYKKKNILSRFVLLITVLICPYCVPFHVSTRTIPPHMKFESIKTILSLEFFYFSLTLFPLKLDFLIKKN